MDVALLRLVNLERNDYGRKSTGFLGFMKESRSESEADHLKATAARCYARIAAQTPVSELLLKVLGTRHSALGTSCPGFPSSFH